MDDLYDEFGNYIGPIEQPQQIIRDHMRSEEEEQEIMEEKLPTHQSKVDVIQKRQITKYEERELFPRASQIYGPNVETLVEEQDTQPLAEPIIAPVRQKRIQLLEPTIPTFRRYDLQKLTHLMNEPRRIRNVVLLGQIHHGKTSLVDLMVKSTHTAIPKFPFHFNNKKVIERNRDEMAPLGYSDAYFTEQLRKISLKAKCMSLVGEDTNGTSYLLNLLDTPGHADFMDETTSMMRIADGAILVVDVVEGLLGQAERLLKIIQSEQIPVVLFINKIDRLITELNLPPTDAFFKIRHVISELNTRAGMPLFSPLSGNVIFGSLKYGWCFDLDSISRRYGFGPEFSERLWGDITRQDQKFFKATALSQKRTFVEFVLEPLYKIHSAVLGEDSMNLRQVVHALGVRLKTSELNMNAGPLLELVMGKFLQWNGAQILTSACSKLADPIEGAKRIVSRYFCPSELLY